MVLIPRGMAVLWVLRNVSGAGPLVSCMCHMWAGCLWHGRHLESRCYTLLHASANGMRGRYRYKAVVLSIVLLYL